MRGGKEVTKVNAWGDGGQGSAKQQVGGGVGGPGSRRGRMVQAYQYAQLHVEAGAGPSSGWGRPAAGRAGLRREWAGQRQAWPGQ